MRTAPKKLERTWTASLVGLGALIVSASALAQDPPARPDTSGWKCEKCPYDRGYSADYSLGGTYVSDDAYRFGNATGYDEDGGYVFAEGSGRFIDDNYRMQWELVDLGVDARSVAVEGGKPGVYGYTLGYSELPYRRFGDTQTIFRYSGDETLVLPPGWVGAPTTAGMTALGASLVPQNIESDRTTYEVGAEYQGLRAFEFEANYRRTMREGWDIVGASFYNSAALLAAPLDDQTDVIDASVSYTQDRWFLKLGWTGSFYDNSNESWSWENPYFTGAGVGAGQIAQAPDSDAQAISLSGAYYFPARTVVSASASIGEIEQDDALLPYTINPALPVTPLPLQNFDGKVDTTNYDLRVTSQPWDFLRLRAIYRYDERDDKSSVALWSRTITDLFPSNDPEANRPYSFERQRLGVSAKARFDWFDWLRAFRFEAGYDRYEIDRTLQEAPDQNEDIGWGQVSWRATAGPEISLKAGTARRDIETYDLTLAAQYEQNPLLRKYNLAYRYREFIEGRANLQWADLPVTFGLQAYYAADDYTESPLGLQKADDLRFGADVTWSASENVTTYLQASWENIDLRTVNSETFNGADWFSEHEDEFQSIGAGVNFANVGSDRLGLRFNVTYAESTGEIDVNARFSPDGSYPELNTELISATLDADYRLTDAMDLRLRLRYEDFSSNDWQLQGVEPATIPTVITLGADPYNYDVYLVTLALRYSFGRPPRGKIDESE